MIKSAHNKHTVIFKELHENYTLEHFDHKITLPHFTCQAHVNTDLPSVWRCTVPKIPYGIVQCNILWGLIYFLQNIKNTKLKTS